MMWYVATNTRNPLAKFKTKKEARAWGHANLHGIYFIWKDK
jgi:hypothetical protein